MSNIEQTLSIIGPDAVERDLQDQIKGILKKGFEIIKEKNPYFQRRGCKFYKVHETKPFTTIYVIICRQDQLLSWHFKKEMQ